MLTSVRKDIEEIESRLDLILNKQIELESAMGALRVHLTDVMQSETSNLGADIALKFQEQSKGLASTISNLRSDLLEQSALEKSEIIASIAAFETRQHQQTESLRAQMAEQFQAVQARHDELLQGVETSENAALQNAELEIDDASPQALGQWNELVGARLKQFGDAQGMPRSFAWQLLQELKELIELNRQITSEEDGWGDRLDELQRALFAPERSMPWTSLTPHNSTDAQRRELRVLETAVAQMRSYVQENLLRTTGVRPLEIVPRITPFDASVHESNEFLEVPTDEAKKHNLILSVEQAGFQQVSPWGDVRLLRPARVRRYVLQNESAPAAESESEEVEIAPVEDDAPRVSGQL